MSLKPYRYSPSAGPAPLSRHSSIERGRSRDVSPVALARRASEERRTLALAVNKTCRQQQLQHRDTHTRHTKPVSRTSPSPPQARRQLSVDNRAGPSQRQRRVPNNIPSGSTVFHQPQASTSTIPRTAVKPATRYNSTKSKATPNSTPSRFCEPLDLSVASSSTTPQSIQDQIQAAYGEDNMLLARILYLKSKGIEVTSNDDPRIAQVRDEDFVFVPGGELALDEESLAAVREAEKRDKERRCMNGQVHRWQMNEPHKRTGHESAGHERVNSRSMVRIESDTRLLLRESMVNTPLQHGEMRGQSSKFGRFNTDNGITRHSLLSRSLQVFASGNAKGSSPTWNTRPKVAHDFPSNTSQAFGRVRGPLFYDDEPLDAAMVRTPAQVGLLLSLLDGPDEGTSRLLKDGNRHLLARTWTESPAKSSVRSSTCAACSLDSRSTISRTDSWASCSSEVSLSTVVTSPPSSPILKKVRLPSILDTKEQVMMKHSCMRQTSVIVPLSSTPLCSQDGFASDTENVKQFSYNPVRQRRSDRHILVSRVKQSVSTLLDFASKVQQSYIRTIQFAVPIPLRVDSSDGTDLTDHETKAALKPIGYRVNSTDVKIFAPRPDASCLREPLFPTEYNCPMMEANAEPLPPRIFTPIAFVPPSPLRPRYTPLYPEWRLRPIANPVLLRLKALQNILCEHELPWEGRAHAGSLGCGRDRLTGVAFEGLGGSRLAFEAKY